MQNRYEIERQEDLQKDNFSPLSEAVSLKDFTHWRIIENKYPYDAVAAEHHLLITKRVTDGSDLTEEEQQELNELKKTVLNDSYTFLLEALPKEKSIPGHHHLHLIIPKRID